MLIARNKSFTFPALLLLLFCNVSARADEADAFNFYLTSGKTYDDNVFRLSKSADVANLLGVSTRSDNITNTGYGMTFNKRIGRQRLSADMNFSQSRYQNFRFLDFDGRNHSLLLDWRLTDILGGTVGRTSVRSQGSLADLRQPTQFIVLTEQSFVTADLMLHPDWHILSEARQATITNEASQNRIGDSITDTARVGLSYTPASGNWIQFRVVSSEGRLPNREFVSGSFVDNSYRQLDTGLEARYAPTGASVFSGTLAALKRTHANVPSRDLSAPVGNVSWDWAPSGKLQFNTRIGRNVDAVNDLLATYIVTDSLSLNMNWTITAKLSASLRRDRSTRSYGGDPTAAISGVAKRQDTINSTIASLNYAPDRSLVLSARVTSSERSSNYAGFDFEARSVGVSAQFSF